MTNTETHAELGFNRTGIGTSPIQSKEMIAGTVEFPPSHAGDEREIALARAQYVRESEPVGTVPPPVTGKGIASTAITALKGESPTQLIDKLGERLAFERTGTRLYEAIVVKYDAYGTFPGGPSRAEIEQILEDEHEHFRMLHRAISSMGADPTVMTPSASVHATMSKGLLEVTVDPRTTLVQTLEAALLAELADNQCWRSLHELARQAGEEELASSCLAALSQEEAHLIKVKSWIAAAQGRADTHPT